MSAPAPVIRLDDYRPRTSAESLLSEIRDTAKPFAPGNDQLAAIALPALLTLALDLVLEEVDYRANPQAEAAKGCRLLAACINTIEYLKEVAR